MVQLWRDHEVEHQVKGESTLWFRWKFTSTSRTVYSNRRKVYYELRRGRALLRSLFAERRYVWGLDSSLTGTGLTVIDLKDESAMMDRFTTHNMASLVDRSCSLIDWLGSKYELYTPVIILMESTFFSMNTAESLILTKLNHALEVGLYSMGGALYKGVSPMSLKKYIAGTGPAKKTAVQGVLSERIGFTIANNDLADSFGLAIMASDLYRLMLKFPIERYDVNNKNSMKNMLDDIGDFFNDKRKADVIFAMLAGNTGNMFSMTSMLPRIKMASIERETPIFIRYNPHEIKKLKVKDR
jgi:Holliday junction resolvasome RuvABC endonuclease subunit